MKIIKRNGSEEVFDINKIIKAVKKADINSEERSLSDGQIEDIAEYVEFKCNKLPCSIGRRDPGYGREPDHGDRSF